MEQWQAPPQYSGTRTLHYCNRNALDGAPRRFMLRRFRLAESRCGGWVLRKWTRLRRVNALPSDWKVLLNNSCSTDFSAGYPATSGSISERSEEHTSELQSPDHL